MTNAPTSLTLRHADDSFAVDFDTEKPSTWLCHSHIVQVGASRLFGWAHPGANDCGWKNFTLYRTYTFMAQIGFQQTGPQSGRFMPGPRGLLPYEFIDTADVQILQADMVIPVRQQSEEFRNAIIELLKPYFAPPTGILVPTLDDIRNARRQ